MEEKQRNVPTGERILSLLVDLLADQYGVKVKYEIIRKGETGKAADGKQ